MIHYLPFYLGAALLIALLGANRIMGFWGYLFASILLTPIMGLLLLIVSKPKSQKQKLEIDD